MCSAGRNDFRAGECEVQAGLAGAEAYIWEGGSSMKRVRAALVVICLVALSRLVIASDQGSSEQWSGLPAAAQPGISAALGRDISAYHVRSVNGVLSAENAKQEFTAHFSRDSVEVVRGTKRWTLALQGYGYGEVSVATSAAAPQANANRVEYRYGGLTEWYVNGPVGLEQGFTINQAPAGGKTDGQPLVISLTVSGDLTPAVDKGRTSLTLHDGEERAELRDTGLTVRDASGKELPAWFEIQRRNLAIKVNDGGARYPIVIDPWVQQAKLTSSDGQANDHFGSAIAISGDTVVVGVEEKAVYVFVKPAGGWSDMTQTATLTPSQQVNYFGFAVAIDGDTIAVGVPGANSRYGGAYVYVRPAGGWKDMTETAQLTTTTQYYYSIGTSVAISGHTILASSYLSPALVYVRPARDWKSTSTPNATLSTPYGTASLAIGGGTVVIGALTNTYQEGSAFIFLRPRGGWKGQVIPVAQLVASDPTYLFGMAVTINRSGDTVVAGSYGPCEFCNGGKLYVFVKPTRGWVSMTQTAKLSIRNSFGIGSTVAISENGDTIVTGSPYATVDANQDQGTAYVFYKPNGGWKTTRKFNAELTASDGAKHDEFGTSVAISGNSIVSGSPYAAIGSNSQQGAAYVLSRSK
jgi:FG-GAP repeat